MKKLTFVVSLVLGIVITCFAGGKTGVTNKKPIVSVSILPQKFFVEQIAGSYVDVNVILPPGSSPEDFEPTPKQLRDVSNSTFFFYVGHLGFEKTWVKKAANVAPAVKYISCSKGIDLLDDNSDHLSDKAKHHNHGTDPHIWTSPENVKTISRTICSELSLAFPQKKVEFSKNLELFISKIDSLDNHIRFMLSDSTKSSFMIFHPALGYFARDYHLIQHSIEFEGKTPSTAQMKKMVDIARKEKINTIFIQSQFETAKAEIIAKEIGAKVVPIDPLAENWLKEMYSISDKMRDALHTKPNGKSN